MICNHGGHLASKCPALVEPLRDGFYRGQAEPGGHDHDDDDGLMYIIIRVPCTIRYELGLPAVIN